MIPLTSFVGFSDPTYVGNGGRPGGRMNMPANFPADLIQAGSDMAGHNEPGKSRIAVVAGPVPKKTLGIGQSHQAIPPKWMGQLLADLQMTSIFCGHS